MHRGEQYLTIVVTTILVLSTVVPVVGAAPSDPAREGGPGATVLDDRVAGVDEDATTLATGNNSTETDTGAPTARGKPKIDPALRDANGTVEVIVRLESASPSAQATDRAGTDRVSTASTMRSHARETQGQVVRFANGNDGIELVERFYLANAVLLRVDTDRANLRKLAGLQGVTDVHANFQVTLPTPNGSTAQEQNDSADGAAASANGPDTTYGLDQINASQTWSTFDTRGDGVKVAVLDTGVAVDHPDIQLYSEDPSDPTYPGGWAEFNGTGDIVEGSTPHDTGFHGTHTSATVSGGNASGEYIGVAPDVDLMHGLVLPNGRGSFAQIIAGMEWAVENDADVISMSLGAPGYYAAMIEPVRNAEAAGTLVVAATGNDGSDTSSSPGNVHESLAIGASNAEAGIAGFSSGEVIDTEDDWDYAAPSSWPGTYVVPDVSAPGVNVKSAVPEGTFQNYPDAQYGSASGTSMATPHAAGAVALMLAAAEQNGMNVSTREVESALSGTAWKPENCDPSCLRGETDPRYGDGIIDVLAATARLAGDQGITGTVVDASGEPMTGVDVSLASGFTQATDDDGSYRIRGTPGTYRVSTDAFGYEAANATVEVPEDTFVTRDLTLEETVEARVTAGLPGAVRRGSVVTTTVKVANADSVTVDLTGEYSVDNATLFVDGQQHAFGESYGVDDSHSTEVEITVRTDANATGSLGLDLTFAGLGETETVSTARTDVFDKVIQVAATRTTAPGLHWSDQMVNALNSSLSKQYEVTLINDTEMMDVIDEYDVFVVQKFPGDSAQVREFLAAARTSGTGVVLLDHLFERLSEAIPQVSRATGNPATTGSSWDFVFSGDDRVYYEVRDDHPIFEGVASAGDSVPLYGSYWHTATWFNGYRGNVLADVRTVNGVQGSGVAVNALTRTVYLSTLGYGTTGSQNHLRTEQAHQIFANAVRYAGAVSPVTVKQYQPDHAAPGESIEQRLEVIDLQRYTVEVGEESTLTAENLTLYVNDEPAEFGEPISYDGLTSGNFTVRVVPDEDAVGTVALNHTVVAGERNGTLTGHTGSTAVYEPPLTVGEDVPTIQQAVDLAPRDATVLVEGDTYTEQVVVNTTGIDLRPKFGETVTVEAPTNVSGDRVVTVNGDAVNVSDFVVEAGGDNVGVGVDAAVGSTVSDVTVRNATTGIEAVGASTLSPDVNVVSNVVRDANKGIVLGLYSDSLVADNDISDVNTGIRSRGHNARVAFVDNTITDAEQVGIAGVGDDQTFDNNSIEGPTLGVEIAQRSTLTNSTITNVSTGVLVSRYTTFDLEHNAIRNATVGIDFWAGTSGTVRGNELAADTGVFLDRREDVSAPGFPAPHFDFDDYVFRANDLSGSEVAINSTSDDTLDARLNYYGPRGPTNASVVGRAVRDPFLTEAPSELDVPPSGVAETTALGTAVSLPAGDEYALGVPGPTNRSVGEMLGADFEGTVYRYQSRGKPWVAVDDSYVPSALEPLRVVPDSDARAVLSFRGGGTTGREIVRGWNFVTAPTAGAVEAAFANSTANLKKIQSTRGGVTLAEPTDHLAGQGSLDDTYWFDHNATEPTVSPFGGYFVMANTSGTLPANVPANPTVDALYDGLGLTGASNVTGTATATTGETFAESVRTASPVQRATIVDAVVDAFADDPARKAAIRQDVSAALETVPRATIRAALDAASDEEAAAILAALHGTTGATAENATTAPNAAAAPVAP